MGCTKIGVVWDASKYFSINNCRISKFVAAISVLFSILAVENITIYSKIQNNL